MKMCKSILARSFDVYLSFIITTTTISSISISISISITILIDLPQNTNITHLGSCVLDMIANLQA